MHDENQLIQRCKEKDPRAQAALYELYKNRIMPFCLRYFANRTMAEEVFQEGFIRFFSSIDVFETGRPLLPWLKTLFLRAGSNYLRKYCRTDNGTVSLDDLEVAPVSNMKSVVSELDYEELVKLIQKLPDDNRTLINLALIEGLSHKEISEILGISEGNSRVKLKRARTMLIEIIQNSFPSKIQLQ